MQGMRNSQFISKVCWVGRVSKTAKWEVLEELGLVGLKLGSEVRVGEPRDLG